MVPTGKMAGASLVALLLPQLSLVVGVPRLHPLTVHLPTSVPIVILSGQVILGFSVSRTVIVCWQVA